MQELPKTYNPKKTESEILKFWLDNKFYHSEIDTTKKPYVIVIPPPNITGALHMGHALNNTLQDVLIRLAKMNGFNTLWLPGTDHGGIATQNVVERLLLKEGKTRQQLGREKFLEFMWQWRKDTGDTILHQLKHLGCLCDWDRTRFTMDEVCSSAVYKAFKLLFEQGYIYRGERIVNWCPRCKTALADIEVEYKEQKDKLWYIKYPLKAKSVKCNVDHITVATVRPETMLGDTAIAVNPKDERYKTLIGETVILPLMNREIKIIADDVVDPEFGTGAVKVTPAHDPADFEIAQRHNLEILKVIDEDGKMVNVGVYSGLDRFECRKKVEHDLAQLGLIEKVEDYTHNVGICYRCGTIIEPLTSKQWFIRMREIADKAYNAISEGKVVYYPEVYKDYTLNWLQNIKDWCISRQIWWGHRIPVWYCSKSENCPPIVSLEKPEKCPYCKGTELYQDPDVLDTWFSSALWPFSVFGWGVNENNPELKYYYPTQILVTGYEILYLWVARMIMMGLHFLGEVPFREVFVHGIVRDIHGKKMSKSLGNVIDPLDIVDKYGTDALRFSLISSTTAGRDIHLAEESFVSSRNFMNKIYNMTRFILMNISDDETQQLKLWLTQPLQVYTKDFTIAEYWIITELQKLLEKINKLYEKYMLGNIAYDLYEFIWFKFCDWYLEVAKVNISSGKKLTTLGVLIYVLDKLLKLLHPMIPFFTEHMYQNIKHLLPQPKHTILEEQYVKSLEVSFTDTYYAELFEIIKNIITEIRSIKNEFKLPNNLKPNVVITTENQQTTKSLQEYIPYVQRLAYVNNVEVVNRHVQNFVKPKHSSSYAFGTDTKFGSIELFVLLEGMIDFEKEKIRLKKEIEDTQKLITMFEDKLNNKEFMTKAPQTEVEKVKEKYSMLKSKLSRLEHFYSDLLET